MSFIRLLQQNGKAKLATSATLTVATGHDAKLQFTPGYQNLTKDGKTFASAVAMSANDDLTLSIIKPAISLSGATNKDGRLGHSENDYAKQTGIINFAYKLSMKNVVERNNLGDELYESSDSEGHISVQTGRERMIGRWTKELDVEQTIGVPFLCEVPVLKYVFGSTTRNKEKHFYFVSVKAELLHPDTDIAAITGRLVAVPELVNNK
mgnify:FL=1